MNASQCSLFDELSQNVAYHIIVFVKGLLCLAGAIRLCLQWREYGVRFLVHENTKILFQFYYVLNIFHSILLGFMYLSEIYRLRFECFLLDFRYLLLTRCIGISSIVAAHQVITLMSFERLYSSIFPAHFERNSNKLLAVVLATTVIIWSYGYCMMKMSDDFRLFRELKIALPNEMVPENSEGYQSLMGVLMMSNLLSLMMFFLDLYLNFLRKPAISNSLAVSYQLSENRRIILTLLPVEATETVLGFIAAFAQFIHGKLFSSSTPVEHQIFLELTTLVTHFPLMLTFFIKYSVEKKFMNTSQCAIFREISHNVAYHIIACVKGAICLAGAVRICMQWRKYVERYIYEVRFLVHENTKILFNFYYALNLLLASMFAFLHLSELIRLRFECLLFDFRYVLLTRGMGIATVFAAEHVLLVLSFERLYSTFFPAHFERNSSNTLAVILALTSIGGTYIYSMMLLSNDFRLFNEQTIFLALLNVFTTENRDGFKNLMSKMAISNCICLITLCIDLYMNFIRTPATGAPLAVSYQRSENRRIVLTLLPIELTQILAILFTNIALILYGKWNSNSTPINLQLFIETVNMSTYLPLLLTFFINRSVKKRIYKTYPTHQEIDHFESLRKSWNTAA